MYAIVFVQALLGAVVGGIRRFPFGFVAFLAGLSVHMILNLLFLLGIPEGWPELAFRFSYVYGPAFYLYIRALCLRPAVPKYAPLHFLPLALAFISAVLELRFALLSVALPFHLIGYFVLALVEYTRARRDLPQRQSQPVQARLRHVGSMVAVYGGVLAYDFVARLALAGWSGILGLSPEEITLVLVLVLISLMTIRQIEVPLRGGLVHGSQRPRHRQDRQPEQELDQLDQARALIELMERGKLYRNADLTLELLADELGVSERQASRVINERIGMSFSDLVNSYRVQECCDRLVHHPDQPVLEIGLTAGFNSKTSFNVAFRKVTGRTPSEYRRQARTVD